MCDFAREGSPAKCPAQKNDLEGEASKSLIQNENSGAAGRN